ncbi:MAG: hypothetical protein IT158_21830 [Bryobacterales bacterium]|nr:hypothetical protein [Bryobacterales bacterium]
MRLAVVLAWAAPLGAQMAQNPSPMVEHTREHPRLKQETPAGRREALELGRLFLPGTGKRKAPPLLVFFHGGEWLPEVAAARNGMASLTVQIGSGSGVYARAFEDPGRFGRLLAEAGSKAGVPFRRVILGGWSAGCGAVREILRSAEARDRVEAVLLLDGIHAGYANGRPGPLESELETGPLDAWVEFAREAIQGHKRVLITHSEIFPGTFASTTETADYIVRRLGLRRRAVLKWGPMGMQQLSEVRSGRFELLGFAGNSAPDHVDQLHALPEFLKKFRRR